MGLSPSLGTLRRPAFPAKSLNLPSKAKYHRDPQRGFKSNTRTPDERPKWLHEQLREYHHQHNSSGIGPGVTDTNRQINNGGDPERTASAGCHSPDDENKLSHHHQAALRRQGEVQAHKISALEREVYFTESVSRWLEGRNLGTPSSFNLALGQAFRGSPLGLLSTSLLPEDGSYLSELLQCASQHVEDLKRALSDTATRKKAADRCNGELTKERDGPSLKLCRNT
nr:golgin subfamily A member 6-like protein 2 isoform X1 [Saimiri boliviensis boliviensis]XP_039335911.1 golgin subfamily A member 6-like protein 2 isoform X1 [Saimiri boliviensis boliviensis]